MLKKISISYFILGLLVSIGLYYYFFIKSTTINTIQTATIETVYSGSIIESIDAIGSTELIDEQALRFNKLGTITKVNFKDGDIVKKGDIIAEIDNSDGQTAIKEAQLNLDNAKLNLNQLYDNVDTSQILQSQNNISNTEKNLEIGQKELENLKITQSNSLSDIQKSIELTQKELENLKTTQTNSLFDLKVGIDNANIDLENSIKSLDLLKNDLEVSKTKLSNDLLNTISNKDNILNQIETSFLTEKSNISKIIDEIDIILGYTEKNKNINNNYEIYLGAKNSSLKSWAETYLAQSISLYIKLEKDILIYDNSKDINKMKLVLDSILNTYKILQKACDFTYQTIDNSVSSSTFSDSTISSMKSSIYSYKTNTENKITSINSSINSLNTLTDTDLLTLTNQNTISSKDDSISGAILALEKKKQSLETLKNNYLTTTTSYELTYKNKLNSLNTLKNNYSTTKSKNEIELKSKLQSIESTKKSLEVNKQNYKELLEGPTVENIAKAKNSITQAEIKLQDSIDSLKDYELESPFDGIVRKIDYKVGDKLLSDSDKYIYIENPNLVQIPVALDQVDIVKINAGKKVTIKFDAYPTIKVEATINSIDYTPVKTSGVVTYTVYIIITDKSFDKKILSGMTADIEIVTQEKNNILILPTTAITTENDKSYVNLVRNGNILKTEIIIGLSSSGKTEILSGLNLGDKVSVTDFNSTTTTKTSGTSIFGIGTGNKRTSSGSSGNNMGGPPSGF